MNQKWMRKTKDKTTQGHKVKWHQARSWYNKQKLSRKFASEFSGTHFEGENLDSHRVHNFQRITPHKQTHTKKQQKKLRKV